MIVDRDTELTQLRRELAEATRRAESLRSFIEVISSELALEPLLTRIVASAVRLIDAQYGSIGLVVQKAAGPVVRVAAIYNMPARELGAEMPAGVGLAGRVLREQRALRFDRYGDLDLPTLPELADHTVIGAPIWSGDRMIGFFGIGAEPPRRFDDQDVAALALFARHAAIAIENAHRYEQEQRRYETSRRMSAAARVEDVIAVALDQVAARGEFVCTVILYEFDAAGERTGVVVMGRWSPETGVVLQDQRLPYTRDALDPLLDAGETVTISDVGADPRVSDELRAIQTRDARPGLAMIPLIARGVRVGLVILSHTRAHDWLPDDLQPYQAMAPLLAAAIESRRQQLMLYERGQQLAVLEERQRLARDLHDSVTQLIFSVTLIAQSIAPAWRRSQAEGEQRVQRLLELSQASLAEMRALLVELRPDKLQLPQAAAGTGPLAPIDRLRRDGLPAALRAYVAAVQDDGLEIQIEIDSYTARDYEQEAALFRITQEALNNIVKHAHARNVMIRLHDEQHATRLTVTDDGAGFMPVLPTSSGGSGQIGLQTMRERAEAIGAQLEIITAPGRGTAIQLLLPRNIARRA